MRTRKEKSLQQHRPNTIRHRDANFWIFNFCLTYVEISAIQRTVCCAVTVTRGNNFWTSILAFPWFFAFFSIFIAFPWIIAMLATVGEPDAAFVQLDNTWRRITLNKKSSSGVCANFLLLSVIPICREISIQVVDFYFMVSGSERTYTSRVLLR